VIHEMDPCCVLDFYVHESCQRLGLGRGLFEVRRGGCGGGGGGEGSGRGR
jgi:hypothetical protein